MSKRLKFWIVGLIVLLSGCSYPDQEIEVFSVSFPFSEPDSDEGWIGDFADYPEADSLTYALYFNHDFLPENINTNHETYGLHISGNNGNADLFMFLKKKITGLQPNATYELLFNVRVASNATTITGANVYLKVGASIAEPKKELQSGIYRMNIDKGNQAVDGVDMINIGNIGVSSTTTAFTIITRNNSSKNSFTVTTDDSGELWLVIGTDSGFAGLTDLYYTQVDVSFNELN